MTFSLGYCSTTVWPSLAALTKSSPPDRMRAIAGIPTVRSMSATETPLLARLTIIASLFRTPSSAAWPVSWTPARRAGTSGVIGTRIRSARSKIARLIGPYDGCRSTMMKS